MDTIAIHENKESERVVKFINLDNFTDKFINAYNNATICSVYYNNKNEVVALDMWNEEHEDILK